VGLLGVFIAIENGADIADEGVDTEFHGEAFGVVAHPHGGLFHLLVGFEGHGGVVDFIEFQIEFDTLTSVVHFPAEDSNAGEVGGIEGVHDEVHFVAILEREAADVLDGGEEVVDLVVRIFEGGRLCFGDGAFLKLGGDFGAGDGGGAVAVGGGFDFFLVLLLGDKEGGGVVVFFEEGGVFEGVGEEFASETGAFAVSLGDVVVGVAFVGTAEDEIDAAGVESAVPAAFVGAGVGGGIEVGAEFAGVDALLPSGGGEGGKEAGEGKEDGWGAHNVELGQ
jgi:hypothetical protein